MKNKNVIILGGGIAGLSAAATLLRGGMAPLVLENSSRVGGAIQTIRENGFLAECGPNSLMLENDGTEKILRELGLAPLESSAAAKKRFLVCRGKVTAAPSSPHGALMTPLLSWRGKLRFLAEPFAKKNDTANEETVADFGRRRLGDEAVQRLIDPMIAGIYAGDAEKLSLKHALPRLGLMEKKFGSLMLAGLRTGRAAPKRRSVNFLNGMESIPAAMAAFLGREKIQTGVILQKIENTENGWTVSFSASGKNRTTTAAALVIAIPPRQWNALPLPDALKRHLRDWDTLRAPPVSVISLGFEKSRIAHALDGFGFLVPKCEQRKILGTLFQSSVFPKRAPDGFALLTTFVGGTRQPELCAQNDTAQIQMVRDELADLLGIEGAPVFSHISQFSHAIPQYETGFGKLLNLLDEAERDCTGLHFCGNFRGGISVPKTILNAHRTAEKILQQTANF